MNIIDSVLCGGKEIHVKEYINHGASADVYLAELEGREVALKRLREQTGKSFRSEFEEEAKTLRQLWENWKRRFPDERPIVPEYFCGEFLGETPFIVMEFIHGKPLDEVMKISSEGVFNELQGLELARQIGQLFVVLHEDLRKCYGDIKYKNFLIIESNNQEIPALRVIDWNVLLQKSMEGIQRDLLYATSYLYFVLTGHSPKVNKESLSIEYDSNLLDNLSRGTKRFIEKCFHPDWKKRFESAQEWLVQIQELLNWWKLQPAEELIKEAQHLKQDKKESENYLQSLLLSESLASIAVKRGVQKAEDLLADIDEEISPQKAISRIKNYLETNACKPASSYYRQASAYELFRDEREFLIWGLITQIAEEMGDQFYLRLKKFYEVVDFLLTHQWSDACAILYDYHSDYSTFSIQHLNHLEYLRNICEIGSAFAQAKCEEVSEHMYYVLRSAYNKYSRLPEDCKRIIDFNVEEEFKHYDERFSSMEEAKKLCENAKKSNSIEEAITHLEEALKRNRNITSKCVKEIIKESLKHEDLRHEDFEDIFRLARWIRQQDGSDEWIVYVEEVMTLMAHFETLFERQAWYRIGAEAIALYGTYYPEEKKELFCKVLNPFLRRVLDYALNADDFLSAEKNLEALQLWGKISDPEYSEYQKKIKNKKDEIQQNLKISIKYAISKNRFELAKRHFELLKYFASEDVNSIEDIRLEINTKEEEYKRKQNNNDEKIRKCEKQLDDLKQEYEALENALQFAEGDLREKLSDELVEKLIKFYVVLEDISNLGGDSEKVAEWVAWFNSQEKSQKYWEKFSQEAHRYESVGKVKEFLNWCKELKPGQDDPTRWFGQNLPADQWQKAKEYYQKKVEEIGRQFDLQRITELAQSRWVINLAENKPLPIPTSGGSWKNVLEKARELKKDKKNKQKKFAELLQAIDDLSGGWKGIEKYQEISPAGSTARNAKKALLFSVSFLGLMILLVITNKIFGWPDLLKPSQPTVVPSIEVTETAQIPTLTPTQLPTNTPVTPTPTPPPRESKYKYKYQESVVEESDVFRRFKDLGIDLPLLYTEIAFVIDSPSRLSEWQMDVPMDEGDAGYYAFFVEGGTEGEEYKVQDIRDGKDLSPIEGSDSKYHVFQLPDSLKPTPTPTTDSNTGNSGGQAEPVSWGSIGIYKIEQGQFLKVTGPSGKKLALVRLTLPDSKHPKVQEFINAGKIPLFAFRCEKDPNNSNQILESKDESKDKEDNLGKRILIGTNNYKYVVKFDIFVPFGTYDFGYVLPDEKNIISNLRFGKDVSPVDQTKYIRGETVPNYLLLKLISNENASPQNIFACDVVIAFEPEKTPTK